MILITLQKPLAQWKAIGDILIGGSAAENDAGCQIENMLRAGSLEMHASPGLAWQIVEGERKLSRAPIPRDEAALREIVARRQTTMAEFVRFAVMLACDLANRTERGSTFVEYDKYHKAQMQLSIRFPGQEPR